MADLDVTITIGGVDFTERSLASASIVSGRQDMYSVGSPAYAQVSLYDDAGNGFPIIVNDLVVITLESDLASDQVPLFTGRVQDIVIDFVPTFDGPRAVWSMTASSSLALLNRRQVLAGGSPAELDGARARKILQEGLFVRWEEFGAETWADVAADVTWENLPPQVLVPNNDGDYMLAELPAKEGGYNAYSLLADAITSVGGSVIEQGNGTVFYLSAYTRSDIVATEGFITLPTEFFLASSLSGLQQASDLANVIEVAFDGGLEVARDDVSVARFGRRVSVLRTSLADGTVAAARAADLLANFATPRTKLSSIEWALHSFEGSGALAVIVPSLPVELQGLPATLGPINRFMFVEGLEWTLFETQRTLKLYVSDAQLSLASDRWQDVSAVLEWDDVAGTLQWDQARRVTT